MYKTNDIQKRTENKVQKAQEIEPKETAFFIGQKQSSNNFIRLNPSTVITVTPANTPSVPGILKH